MKEIPNVVVRSYGCKVFLAGKDRPIHLIETAEAVEDAVGLSRFAKVTTEQGETLRICRDQIVSITEPKPTSAEIDPGAFEGYGVEVRGLTELERVEFKFDKGVHPEPLIAVIPEDTVSEIVLIASLRNGRATKVYTNDAEPQQSLRLYLKVVQLLAEAKAIFLDAYEVKPTTKGTMVEGLPSPEELEPRDFVPPAGMDEYGSLS